MPDYTIVKIGNQYVVRTAEQSVLKTTSRRMALRVVAEASHLLELSGSPEAGKPPSITSDYADICDHAEAS